MTFPRDCPRYDAKVYNTSTLPRSRSSRSSHISGKIEAWFRVSQRPLPWRRTYDPYHVWLSEIMLQQTRMEVVLGYYVPFLQRFPDLVSLANPSEDAVMAAWSGLGYYRRARMLRE